MKLGRRAFLQFAAGAVGGTLLSPLPWQLADDSAIWSQNWSWRPSPERGEVTKVPTICLFCGGGCGIQASLVNGHRAIALEGNPGHPVNQGGVCPLGASGAQFLYAPYRISQPMQRDGAAFKPITWDEALKQLAEVLGKIRGEGKPQSVACITGQPRNSMFDLWSQFLAAYGSPNLFQMPGHQDSLQLAASLALGQASTFAFALDQASYVLSFGANLIEGWGAPGHLQSVFRRWHDESSGARSAKLVQVEPRCSVTATKADQWVPLAPGSEAALALGIAHVLIKNKAYDANFVSNHTMGFEDWTDATGKARQGFKTLVLTVYTPQKVAELTGLEVEKIEELARDFAAQQSAVAVWGENHANSPNNVYHDLSFVALNILKGNLKPGGLLSLVPPTPLAPLPEPQIDAIAQQGLEQPRLDSPLSKNVALPGNGLYAFLDTMVKGGDYPIKVLFVHEANPIYSLPESKLVQSALQKAGQVISFSSYMDETTMQADLILPNHMALERYDDVSGLPGVPYGYYAVAKPILPPQMDTRHSGEVMLQVASKLGGAVAASMPWKSYEEYLQQRVEGLAASGKGAVADSADAEPWKLQAGQPPQPNFKDGAELWKKLTAGHCWYDAPVDILRSVATESGKCELALQLLQKKGVNVEDDQVYLPHFAPLAPSGDEKEFPLLLVSYDIMQLSTGFLANPPFMTKTLFDFMLKQNDLFVEINPQTAQSIGLSQGDRALVRTPQGELSVRVRLFAGARPGAVFIVQGLGHTAYDQYIQGKGVNANNVIEVQMDPLTGLGTVWATRAQLRRA